MADQEEVSEGVEHNHLTCDLKPEGQCPKCDEQRGCSEVVELTKVRLTLGVNVDAAQIAKTTNPLQMFDLIKELDDETGIWALTVLLARHFDRELEIASQHVPDLLGMTDEQLIAELIGDGPDEEVAA